MSFEVVNPGMLSLLQDLGRRGYQHLGIAQGGPMDEHAFCWGNRLLGNPLGACGLEITLGQLQLKATEPTTIAITGADLKASLNDKPVSPWCTYAIQPGDELSFSRPVSGVRAYLCVQGGFICQPQLGSVATVVREGTGGLNATGQPLKTGDLLRYTPCREPQTARVPKWARPDYAEPLSLGVISSYQHDVFPAESRALFFSSAYQITPDSDRMGYRLAGPQVACEQSRMISEGIVLGAIQIPQDGQPIVLMRDRQTIGGYPKIGCLTTLGTSRLSQCLPGQSVQFRPLALAEAESEWRLFQQIMSA
ncbi:biotin-dependent carboxyltransferase family protein [Vibrio quintilis]|uniref:KipI antagonist n=1 Tax=Vibrio quintilis TaxID=1117707 RepID=A0A1M7YW72_9VIBR|nr:biotin-dependent carboxyltransferase family protein [Vibrio quintilis]SHO56897.1 KipI antagonist [Vibrio quintilis]